MSVRRGTDAVTFGFLQAGFGGAAGAVPLSLGTVLEGGAEVTDPLDQSPAPPSRRRSWRLHRTDLAGGRRRPVRGADDVLRDGGSVRPNPHRNDGREEKE